MLYVREDVSWKFLGTAITPTDDFYVKINLWKKKMLHCCFYTPNQEQYLTWLENMTETLALYPLNYANLIIEGHSNVGIENNYMEDFCDKYDNKTLKELTCY